MMRAKMKSTRAIMYVLDDIVEMWRKRKRVKWTSRMGWSQVRVSLARSTEATMMPACLPFTAHPRVRCSAGIYTNSVSFPATLQWQAGFPAFSSIPLIHYSLFIINGYIPTHDSRLTTIYYCCCMCTIFFMIIIVTILNIQWLLLNHNQ